MSDARPTVTAIVEEYLREHGYDGLHHEDDCGCLIGALCPCGGCSMDCKAGYKSDGPAGGEWDGSWVIGPRATDSEGGRG